MAKIRLGRRKLGVALVGISSLVIALVIVSPGGGASAQSTTLSVDTTQQLTEGGTFQGFGINDNTGRLWSQANAIHGVTMTNDYDWNTYVGPRLAALHPAFARELVDLTWFAYNQTNRQMYDDATLATDSCVQNGFTYAGPNETVESGCHEQAPPSGGWTQNSPAGAYFSSRHVSSEAGDTASIPCTNCTGFQYFAITGPNEGIASVQVDGGEAVDVPLTSPVQSGPVYTTPALSAGSHTLTITVKSGTVNVDAVAELGEPGIVYTWDSPLMHGFVTDLEELQSVGSQAILTISQIAPWMTGTPSDVQLNTGADGKPAANYPMPTADASHIDDWTTAIVALLDYLKSIGINNVMAIGAPNELGDVDAVANLNAGYAALRLALNSAGYDDIQLFGPDMFGSTQPVITAKKDKGLNTNLKFYDWHAYYGSGADIGPFYSQQHSLSLSVKKPVWITEFGERATGNNTWTQLPTFLINGVNSGASAMAEWDFVDMVFGGAPVSSNKPSLLWGLLGPGPTYTPKTSFYAFSDVTAHTEAGSQVFPVSCSGTCSGVQVAALRDGNGEDAVLVYNTTAKNWAADITYNGPDVGNETLYKYQINPASLPTTTQPDQLLSYSKAVSTISANTFLVSVSGKSFAVFSATNPIGP
jgi:hypothetical protein